MPVRQLPSNPNLQHLKYQAKDLLKGRAARDLSVAQRIREFHPRFHHAADDEIFSSAFTLADAQLAIARESGFATWARLKAQVEKPRPAGDATKPHHERIEDARFRLAVDLLDAGDVAGLRACLNEHRQLSLAHVIFEGENYFRNPTLLEFVAENPIRHGTLPANILEIAKVILHAGADRSAINETLGLVCSGRVARECGVQIPLIDLLCDRGADPESAMQPAMGHGEFEAVQALLHRGARMTLPVAAALGRDEDARRLLPGAGNHERHCALALAAQFGHADIARMLLDSGEDPSRYNPAGYHSHSTPLHQAALAGHQAVVHLLVERGAKLDIPDIMWKGTPADWAAHAGKTELEKYLRNQMDVNGRP
jgi:Ankyrin repeats (3 copies)